MSLNTPWAEEKRQSYDVNSAREALQDMDRAARLVAIYLAREVNMNFNTL